MCERLFSHSELLTTLPIHDTLQLALLYRMAGRVGKDEELHMSTSCFNFSLFYVPPFVPSGARSQPVAPHSNCPCTATAVLALPLILCVRRHGRAAVASLPRDSRSGIGDGPESGDESAHAQLIPVRAGRRASDRVQMGFGARL